MRAGDALLLVCSLLPSLCPAQTLRIRLYDYADLTGDEIRRLVAVTTLVLGHAGLAVDWTHCRGVGTPVDGTSHCETGQEQGSIIMRIQPAEPDRPDHRLRSLGHSFVNPAGGSYSSVFVPAVRGQSKELGVPFDLLIGYAVAHEVGHCLLGTAHSHSGLMRAAWDKTDAGEMNRLALGLTPIEKTRALARVTKVGVAPSR